MSISTAAPEDSNAGEPAAGLRRFVASIRGDELLRNSFYLALSFATMGAFGFAFWTINARLFTASQVGIATTLISATTLVSYLSLLGFNSTFVRYLPTSRNRNSEINTGLILVFGAGLVLGALYIGVVPSFTPKLLFVRSSPIFFGLFVIFAGLSAVNIVTDFVFIAYRAAKFNFIVDGILQSGTKLILPVMLVSVGSYGIFASVGAGATVAVAFSIFFMVRFFQYRPKLEVSQQVVRTVFRYSAGNYVANLLNIAPIMALPLIVLDGIGPAAAGYYYITFQVATLLYAGQQAICNALFAEGSYADAVLPKLARRSGLILLGLSLPAGVLLAVLSRWILLVFGGGYSHHATSALVVFALAAPAAALYNWTDVLLKVLGRVSAVIWTNVMFAVIICGLAIAWVNRGIAWVAFAWLLGNLAAGLAALGVLIVCRFERSDAELSPAC